MGVPNRDELANPLLTVLKAHHGTLSVKEQERAVLVELGLEEEDAKEIHRGSRTKLQYNLAWARYILKHLGLIQNVSPSVWQLTSLGHSKEFISSYDIQIGNRGAISGEELEGDGTPSDETFGVYPIDSVLIRQETRTASEIIRRIEKNQFIMDPDFQRDFVWPVEKQSRLIESTFLRIPLPVFYLAEREDGRTVVVDGLQRLTTFRRFLSDEFELRGLDLCKELNGESFQGLSPRLQNRVEDAQCILYLIDSKAPERVKLDIFERVNGGIPLSRQQMRNCLYTGPATRWLKEEAKDQLFLQATGHSLSRNSMRDRECINRFCAFTLLTEQMYSKGDMDSFLAETLRKMNTLTAIEFDDLRSQFRRSMKYNFAIFGKHAFRKHSTYFEKRNVINVALFDVFSVLLSNLYEMPSDAEKRAIRECFYKLLRNPHFHDAISLGTNASVKVKTRFKIAREELSPILKNVEGTPA